ncbi:MAG TPA: MOSC domain-containing protein [Verrucomicrobiae bacterium]
MTTPQLLSIQTAAVTDLPCTGSAEWWDKPWTSAFHKQAVNGRIWLGYEGLRGDQQADRKNHGGVDKALCVYEATHYPVWFATLGIDPLPAGAFGENFTVQGLPESEVCIGDVYQLGAVRVQVSQPRQPCWKLARRWRLKDFTAHVIAKGWTGFYFRVLQHGWVEAGTPFTCVERPYPQLSVAHAHAVMYHRQDDLVATAELAGCPALAGSWKDALWQRVEGPARP